MKKLIFIFAILLTSCSSLQFQLATLNHASMYHTMRPTINTGFNYVLPSTPYTWNTFNYNRFYQSDPFFYSWNYPLNWYQPNNQWYTFNYNNIISPRRIVRRTPTRPQIQQPREYRRPRVEYTPSVIKRPTPPRTRTMNTQPDIQRRPTQTRPQTRVSVSSSRRGNNNKKQ